MGRPTQDHSEEDFVSYEDSEGSSGSSVAEKKNEAPKWPQRIGNWWLAECLGSGYSGAVFRATHLFTRQCVALKMQDVDHECPTNRYERNFYPMLQGGKGLPILYDSGVQAPWDFLAMELLGPSIDSLFRKSGRDVMDLRSVCCLGMQVIQRLEFMHARGVLHRDIQLGNCVIGLPPNEKTVYMIDFGFSKQYVDGITRQHIPDSRAKRDFIGNYWFSSVRVHCKGRVPSRRDDLEAAALMLIHLLTPNGLSWTRNGVPKTDGAHDQLKRAKERARASDLCHGLPSEFEEFLRYCRRLGFAERPDYSRWVEAFRSLAVDRGFPEDDAFVWPPVVEPTVRASAHPVPQTSRKEVEGVLKDLAQLNLGEQRPVLGNRGNIPRPGAAAVAGKPAPAKKPQVQTQPSEPEVIVISDDEDENEPLGQKAAVTRLPKAAQLAQLARRVPDATDNAMLARVTRDFADVLQSSRSRTLTKEGFAFLDALYKQLADPSVFAVPLRTSRTRSGTAQEHAPEADARRIKMDVLFRLRRDVAQAKSNRALAKMVTDFGACIDKSKGRTLTKDALGFLDGLVAALRAVPC